ncbi:LysR family transcriptional regulator [Dactylosporangium sp. CS-047395]|uniref:LysR family transcriptional regulator n=1 Tax=Dactylosporangium sp. CS-047395 TaxID=3239936 RepID=UPI003D8E729C
MDLRQLEYFVAVAEERSFTKGARRVRIVQSAVSAAVQKLERGLGAELFDRGGPQIELTDAGAALLPEAQAMLAGAQRARDAVAQAGGGLRGTVTVGALLSIMPIDIPAILGRFHVAHPDVTVRLRTSATGTGGLVEAIADGILDVAVVATMEAVAGVRLQHIADDSLQLVVPAGHPLAHAGRVRLRQLEGEPFIDFPTGWGNRTVADRAFSAAGVSRDVRFEAADGGLAVGLVRNGLGMVFLPSSVRAEFGGLHTVEIDDASLNLPIALATPSVRTLSPAASTLVNDIRRSAPALRT